MDNLIAAGIVILVLWAIVEFVGVYWQILLALAAVGALVYIVFRSDKKPADKPAENFEYEVKQSKPQLPPMPYSAFCPRAPPPYEQRAPRRRYSRFFHDRSK